MAALKDPSATGPSKNGVHGGTAVSICEGVTKAVGEAQRHICSGWWLLQCLARLDDQSSLLPPSPLLEGPHDQIRIGFDRRDDRNIRTCSPPRKRRLHHLRRDRSRIGQTQPSGVARVRGFFRKASAGAASTQSQDRGRVAPGLGRLPMQASGKGGTSPAVEQVKHNPIRRYEGGYGEVAPTKSDQRGNDVPQTAVQSGGEFSGGHCASVSEPSSASRFTAGAAGFLILSHWLTLPDQPSAQACQETIMPSPGKCLLRAISSLVRGGAHHLLRRRGCPGCRSGV